MSTMSAVGAFLSHHVLEMEKHDQKHFKRSTGYVGHQTQEIRRCQGDEAAYDFLIGLANGCHDQHWWESVLVSFLNKWNRREDGFTSIGLGQRIVYHLLNTDPLEMKFHEKELIETLALLFAYKLLNKNDLQNYSSLIAEVEKRESFFDHEYTDFFGCLNINALEHVREKMVLIRV